MAHGSKTARFPANPIEVVIFSVVTLIFVNSLYGLVHEQGGVHPRALVAMSSSPLTEGRRHLASSRTKEFAGVGLTCDTQQVRDTKANRVRLMGAICGMSSAQPLRRVSEITVAHATNRFHATVFPDYDLRRYTTDYIPLVPGSNSIHVEFKFGDGQTLAQDLTVNSPHSSSSIQ